MLPKWLPSRWVCLAKIPGSSSLLEPTRNGVYLPRSPLDSTAGAVPLLLCCLWGAFTAPPEPSCRWWPLSCFLLQLACNSPAVSGAGVCPASSLVLLVCFGCWRLYLVLSWAGSTTRPHTPRPEMVLKSKLSCSYSEQASLFVIYWSLCSAF